MQYQPAARHSVDPPLPGRDIPGYCPLALQILVAYPSTEIFPVVFGIIVILNYQPHGSQVMPVLNIDQKLILAPVFVLDCVPPIEICGRRSAVVGTVIVGVAHQDAVLKLIEFCPAADTIPEIASSDSISANIHILIDISKSLH